MIVSFELNDIAFSYGDTKIIDEISLKLDSGKFYGIIGPNGCGKTTLLDLLVKHKSPAAGVINYHDKDLARYSIKRLAREMALVPQNFYINFPFTALEVVMMGRYPHIPRFSAPSAEDHRIVAQIMAEAEVTEFENRYVTELSGGERQRVVFARALAQETPVLLLDEATSNLDINHSLSLLKATADKVKQTGKTVIAVMQDINLAALFCDNLIFMKHGKIVAHGPTGDVLNPETIRSVFNVETQVNDDLFSQSKLVVFRH
jgi:iron complex transport system ATP-binding protein